MITWGHTCTEQNYGIKLIRRNNYDRKQNVKNLCFCLNQAQIQSIPGHIFQLQKNQPGNEASTTRITSIIPPPHSTILIITLILYLRKYDFRISDCTECILLAEHQNSIPFQMARNITDALCRLWVAFLRVDHLVTLLNISSPNRKLNIILRGSSPNNESSWKVEFIRQRVQRQYEWKPEKKYVQSSCYILCTLSHCTFYASMYIQIMQVDFSPVWCWCLGLLWHKASCCRQCPTKWRSGYIGVWLLKERSWGMYNTLKWRNFIHK